MYFDLSRFTPHGFCLAWDPGLIWLEAGSDIMIALAYFSIPAALLVFMRRRRDLAFKPIFALFAAFILACGSTHVLNAVTLWVPLYWLDGTIRAITAALSVATAITLWPLLPKALALPSPDDLRLANEALARELAHSKEIDARQRAAEAALRASEDRLRQAQKMEAVGQLTGGIAHDFNNLLTATMGALELLQRRPELDERALRLAGIAMEGSRKAARLTSQLLTFSRRQMLSPEALDPSAVIAGMHDLLARSLGDTRTLEIIDSPGRWRVLADRNQVEAALLNLVINARDAMAASDAGTVTISLTNLALEGTEPDLLSSAPESVRPGDYISIAVADTGTGMTADVLARACEPFFTTKPHGAGTGLGLSQIYGFASQSGGALRISSAPGEGTRIEMILPRGA